jgi:2-polyprenyl-3-methyl-5-hydroxy-6-metoxy-1,4-benzoquinol methylase
MSEKNIHSVKTLNRRCPICGSTTGLVLHTQSFILPTEYKLPDSYDVVSCQACGFTFADTPADQEAYDRFYTICSKYEDDRVATGGGAQDWDAERLEQTAETIASLLPNKESSILDIGCAGGGLLVALRNRGYENVVGLDPSPACVEKIKVQGIKAYLGGIFKRPGNLDNEARKQFDLVILSHVLEHILDVEKAINNVIAWLAPEGLLYIETPNASQYKDHFKVPFYYFDIEHINHFDLASLRNLAGMHKTVFIAGEERTMKVSEDNDYPVIYGVLKNDSSGAIEELTPDFSARQCVNRFIEMSKERDNWPELEALATSQEPVVVWGAGSYAQRLMQMTPLGRCNILAFVDNDKTKQGTLLENVEIKQPRFVKECDATIIVCAALQSDAILLDIADMGAANRVIVLKGSEYRI